MIVCTWGPAAPGSALPPTVLLIAITTPDPDEYRREQILAGLDEFPRELRRCTCRTPSFDPDDHSNSCALGPAPPLSSNLNYRPATRLVPDDMFSDVARRCLLRWLRGA